MPRTRRNFGTKGLNHCIVRGIDKKDIFFDKQDRQKYLKELVKYKEKYNVKIGTYVLMQNHVHLLVQGEDKSISDFFHSLLISYSLYFNKKYDRVGHLFENRYKNKMIDDEIYLKNVVKYIHYNPEKAGICRFDKFEWSGYWQLLSDKTWLDKDIILLYYNDDSDEARKILIKEHLEGLNRYYEEYVEYEMVSGLTDEQVISIIKDKINDFVSSENKFVLKEKNINNNILKEILNIKGVSINQVNRITGINRRLLTKIKE